MSLDRRAWRDANAHLFAPPPRTDGSAAQIVSDLQSISRKLDTVQRETSAAELSHQEVLRSIAKELFTLVRAPFPTHDELATPESCFAAIELIRQRLHADGGVRISPDRVRSSSHPPPGAASYDSLRRLSPRSTDGGSTEHLHSMGLSEGTAAQALRRVCEVLGGDVNESSDTLAVVRQAGELAVSVTRRLEVVTRDHVVSVGAFEAYARDVRTAFAGFGVVAPDAGEYVRRAADPAALHVLSDGARRSTEWYTNVVAKLRSIAANLTCDAPEGASLKPAAVTQLVDSIEEASKEFATVANRNVAERSAAQVAILADLNLEPHHDLNAARGQVAKLHGALDAAVAEFTGAAHDSPTLAQAVSRATGVLRAAVGGADRLVASRVEEWISHLRVAAGRHSNVDDLGEQVIVAPREVLEREIESCLTAVRHHREATTAQIIQLEERLDTAVTTANSLTTSAATFAGEMQSRVRIDIEHELPSADVVDRIRGVYHEVLAKFADMETTLGRVTRQSDAARLERVRIEELVRARLTKLADLTAALSNNADAMREDSGTNAPQDIAARLDRLEAIVTETLRHAEKSDSALQAEKVRITNFNDTQRKLSKKCKTVMTELNELCVWLGVRTEDVEACDGFGPMQWLGAMQNAVGRCKETCAVAGDDESDKPEPTAVGAARVKASAMALRHCAELQAELNEARASEQQLSESLVATSKRLGESLAKAKAIMRTWSVDLEAEAADERRHVFTVTLEGRGEVRHCDTDDVPDEVELTSVPMHYRVVSLGEAIDFFAVAIPQATERLVSSCGYLQRVLHELTGGQKADVSDGYFSDLVSSVSHLADQLLIAMRQGHRQPATPTVAPQAAQPLERNNARVVTSPERPVASESQAADSPSPPRRSDIIEPPYVVNRLQQPGAVESPFADHRLVRVAIALSRAWTAMTTVAEVKYLRLGGGGTASIMTEGEGKSASIISGRSFFPWLPTDHDLLRDVRQVRVDVLHDTLVPELENAAGKLESLVKAFSEGYKRSSIVIQRDMDTIQNHLFAGLDAVNRTVNVDGLVQDPAKFEDVVRAIAPESRRLQEGSYFFDRPDGEGKSVCSVAADYARALLDTLVHISARWKDLVDGQKRELVHLNDVIASRVIAPGVARGENDPWGMKCRALGESSDLVRVVEAIAEEVTKAHCSTSFMGAAAMSHVAELELAVNRLTAERDAAASSAAVARAMLHRVSSRESPAQLSRQPSEAVHASKEGSPLSRNLSYSRTSTAHSERHAPNAKLNDSLSSVSAVAKHPAAASRGESAVSRASSITRSEPLSPAFRKNSPSTARRIGQLSSLQDLNKSPTRVSRQLQRSYYFNTVVEEYASHLDDEIQKRKAMSPPRAEVQLSPMTASPRSAARLSPLRSRSAAERRRLQSYARLHSGRSAQAQPRERAAPALVGGGDVRVVHAAKGKVVRSTSAARRS